MTIVDAPGRVWRAFAGVRHTSANIRFTLASMGLILALVACIAGAVGTAIWTLRFGLLAQRPPLPGWHTAIRICIVLGAGILSVLRRDRLERVALVCAVIAAGSSALFGLGLRSPVLFATRLIFHFLAYTACAAASARLLIRTQLLARQPRRRLRDMQKPNKTPPNSTS